MDLGDLAGVGARDFHHRLVGLQFDHAVVGRDHVALADQHVDHVAAGDVFAEFGQFEFHSHWLHQFLVRLDSFPHRYRFSSNSIMAIAFQTECRAIVR